MTTTLLQDLAPTMTVEEAGEMLGLSRSAAYRAVKRGEIPTITLSGRLYVPTARLLAMLGLGPHPDRQDVDEQSQDSE